MSSTYTANPSGGSGTTPVSITVPSDGDADTAASVNGPLEKLADQAEYTRQHAAFKNDINTFGFDTTFNAPVTTNADVILNAAPIVGASYQIPACTSGNACRAWGTIGVGGGGIEVVSSFNLNPSSASIDIGFNGSVYNRISVSYPAMARTFNTLSTVCCVASASTGITLVPCFVTSFADNTHVFCEIYTIAGIPLDLRTGNCFLHFVVFMS